MYKKIYLSGKITGLPYEEALKKFSLAESIAKTMALEVVNPMTIEHNHDLSWESYMKQDLKALLDCDSIYMLNNWTESKGAIIEHKLASDLKLSIYTEL
jgi:hypothetical protein